MRSQFWSRIRCPLYVRAGIERLPILCLLAACTPAAPPAPTPEPVTVRPPSRVLRDLEGAIHARLAELTTGEVAIAFVDLETGRRIGINENVAFHAASTMKVPILIELFRQAEHGRLRLDDSIVLKNEFTSIADRSRYALTAADDSDSTLYALIGRKVPVRDLVRRMIARSSNLASNNLIELVSADSINRTLWRYGAGGMTVRRGVEDNAAFRRNLNNLTSADGFARTLEIIARCRDLAQASCAEMTQILAAQEFTDMLPAGVPAGTRVANKTGWITGIQHDGAIVYPPNQLPYVLVVLTRGIADPTMARKVGADVSRLTWNAVTRADWRPAPIADDVHGLFRRHRNPGISARRFDQNELLRAVEPYRHAFEREQVGTSVQGRPLYVYKLGSGETRVLLWSQMHGNESTASMTLTELMKYIAESPNDPRVRNWKDRLTVLLLPMLNPDGAARFARQNDYGIDINRDARAQVTPEGRALKSVRDRYSPQFGFNLHDQSPRTRVGNTDRLAAIALLAPPKGANLPDDEQMIRAKKVAGLLRTVADRYVAGYVTRYDETFNPRAFGDLMQQWGTTTVLIESGGWSEDPEKQYLRAVNFSLLVHALDAIANRGYEAMPLARYASLPPNGRPVSDLLIRGGHIVHANTSSYRADITADLQGADGSFFTITEIGDLEGVDARDTIDVSGLYLHPPGGGSRDYINNNFFMPIGGSVEFSVLRGEDPGSEAVGRIVNGKYTALRTADLVPAGPPHAAVGCYRVQVGRYGPERINDAYYSPPSRVQFLWRRGAESREVNDLLIRPLRGTQPSHHTMSTWRPLGADSVEAFWSTGFSGMRMRLRVEGQDLAGRSITFTDVITPGRADPSADVKFVRISCESQR